MNTGIQDASQPGLEAGLRRRVSFPGPDALLASYEAERRVVAWRVLAATHAVFLGGGRDRSTGEVCLGATGAARLAGGALGAPPPATGGRRSKGDLPAACALPPQQAVRGRVATRTPRAAARASAFPTSPSSSQVAAGNCTRSSPIQGSTSYWSATRSSTRTQTDHSCIFIGSRTGPAPASASSVRMATSGSAAPASTPTRSLAGSASSVSVQRRGPIDIGPPADSRPSPPKTMNESSAAFQSGHTTPSQGPWTLVGAAVGQSHGDGPSKPKLTSSGAARSPSSEAIPPRAPRRASALRRSRRLRRHHEPGAQPEPEGEIIDVEPHPPQAIIDLLPLGAPPRVQRRRSLPRRRGAVDLVELDDVVWTDPPDRGGSGPTQRIGAVARDAAIDDLGGIGGPAIRTHARYCCRVPAPTRTPPARRERPRRRQRSLPGQAQCRERLRSIRSRVLSDARESGDSISSGLQDNSAPADLQQTSIRRPGNPAGSGSQPPRPCCSPGGERAHLGTARPRNTK